MPVQIPTEKWSGQVREVTLGATQEQGGTRSHTVTVGGETTLPFLHFEGQIPHAPLVALEIKSRLPQDWSPLLLEAWGEAERCDLMLVVGSSLEIAPAAEIPFVAGRHGARSIVINYQPTPLDSQADVVIPEDVAKVLPQIIGQVGRLVD